VASLSGRQKTVALFACFLKKDFIVLPIVFLVCGAGSMILSRHNNGILDAGDIESMPFIEALGQFSYRVGEESLHQPVSRLMAFFSFNCLTHFFNALSCNASGAGNFCLVHVSLVPVLNVVGEQVCSCRNFVFL